MKRADSPPIIVRMQGNLIEGQDGLTACYNACQRNKPAECDLPIGTLIGQLREIVVKALRNANIYIANFRKDGVVTDTLVFVGNLPPNVSEEAAVEAALRA